MLGHTVPVQWKLYKCSATPTGDMPHTPLMLTRPWANLLVVGKNTSNSSPVYVSRDAANGLRKGFTAGSRVLPARTTMGCASTLLKETDLSRDHSILSLPKYKALIRR